MYIKNIHALESALRFNEKRFETKWSRSYLNFAKALNEYKKLNSYSVFLKHFLTFGKSPAIKELRANRKHRFKKQARVLRGFYTRRNFRSALDDF